MEKEKLITGLLQVLVLGSTLYNTAKCPDYPKY